MNGKARKAKRKRKARSQSTYGVRSESLSANLVGTEKIFESVVYWYPRPKIELLKPLIFMIEY